MHKQKRITQNQITGEQGETAVKGRFLAIGFQFDARSRLEAGIDGIAEVMKDGEPLAKMIAVQVKTTQSGKYIAETEVSFSYTVTEQDFAYWRESNIPIIIVLHRISDNSFYWKEIQRFNNETTRQLKFNKSEDALDKHSVDKLAAITIPKKGFGYYVPPLGGGETAIVNAIPLILPDELFVATTPYSSKAAYSLIKEAKSEQKFDWIINGGVFWSFSDPRKSACREIVDLDQIEAIETKILALQEEVDEKNKFSCLLRMTLASQVRRDLAWNREKKIYYFCASEPNKPKTFMYKSTTNNTEAEVISVYNNKKQDENKVEYVRHHAFAPRYELICDEWFIIINPTYHFTTDGIREHRFPGPLLSGKKKLDKSSAVRGQVIMWHRYLISTVTNAKDLFSSEKNIDSMLRFGDIPTVELETKVPEDVWGNSNISSIVNSEKIGGLFE